VITWSNLRSSAAPWLVLPALVYVGLYIDDVIYTVPSRYGVESGELAAYGMAIIAPGVAAAAAWEGGRHRLLGVMRTTSARALPQQLLWAATPVLIMHIVLITGALVMARRAVGVWPDGAGWLAVAHLFILPLGWLIIGWYLGGVLPRSIAAPTSGIGCWAWLSIPHTLDNPWARHLGGFIDGTSTVTDIRDPAVYTVPWLVVAGLALAFWLMANMRRRVWGAAMSVTVVVITFVTGRVLVNDWGYQHPTNPRSVALACIGEAPRVCVPPEYKSHAAQLRQDALVPLGRLKDAGLSTPRELRLASPMTPLQPGTWPLYWSLPGADSGNDNAQYAASLAQSAVVGTAMATGMADCRQPSPVATAWAALVIGMDEQAVRQGSLESDWLELEKVRERPANEQTGWFNRAAADQNHCNPDAS
jgi:hypothetical protein